MEKSIMECYQKTKLESMLNGNKEICSDYDLDTYHAIENIPYVISIINPNQVGILDRYLCWINLTK